MEWFGVKLELNEEVAWAGKEEEDPGKNPGYILWAKALRQAYEETKNKDEMDSTD